MQENLDQTEDELSKINDELREQIQNLGIVQLFVMLLMGGLWIVIISRANKWPRRIISVIVEWVNM